MDNNAFLKAVEDNALRLSFTSFSKLDKSPRHFRDHFLYPTDKKTFKAGRVTHTACLEPKEFINRYYLDIKNPFDGRTKEGKHIKNIFELQPKKGKERITEAEYKDAMRRMEGVRSNKAAMELIRAATKIEHRFSFQHKGLTIRGIRDLEHPDFVADLKTTADASPKAFYWSVKKYLYNMQAAIYTYNCNRPYYIIAVEKSGQCAVYSLTEETIQEGRNKFEELVKKYRSCRLSGAWNESYGYGKADGILSI